MLFLYRRIFFLAQGLMQGRTKLQEVNNGERFKLLSRDDNEIDCMFVDRRNTTINGGTLVIACEGNAGFYEIGVMCTPVEAGYSVLGWNHPGFGGSTVREIVQTMCKRFSTFLLLFCLVGKTISCPRTTRY